MAEDRRQRKKRSVPERWEEAVALLERLARRRRWERAWMGFWQGMFWAGVVWLVGLGLYKVLPLPVTFLAGVAAAAGIIPVVLTIVGFLPKEPLLQTAQRVDQVLGLQERVSTALEWDQNHRDSEWTALLREDAIRRWKAAQGELVPPWHLPRIARYVLLVLALGAGLGFVPEYRSAEYIKRQKEKTTMANVGERLIKVARVIRKEQPPQDRKVEAELRKMEELGQKLTNAQLEKEKALEQLSRFSERLRDQLEKQFQKAPALKNLERNIAKAQELMSAKEALQRAMEQLRQKKGDTTIPDEKKLAELMKKIQAMREQIARQAQQPGSLDPSALQSLTQALSDLAKMAAEMGLSPEALERAAEALRKADVQSALKDLDFSYIDLEELAKLAQKLKNLKAQVMKIGKDLAEMLEKGQVPIAMARMKAMANHLRDPNLSTKKLQEILHEVQKALGPAGMYGMLRSFLQDAVDAMKRNDRETAALALEKAIDYLKELMRQAQDCQCQMAMLQALKACSMCMCNGNCWSACQKPGFSPGGRPGSGVGTWSDASMQMTEEAITKGWDNSGIKRPEMQPKGITDRKIGDLSSKLKPTRLQGKLQPGAPMPSVMIRGLNFRGESRVKIHQVVQSAQQEAQRALTEERIPRMYKETVRQYFENLQRPQNP